MAARVYSFPIEQRRRGSPRGLGVAAHLNAAIRYVRRSRLSLVRAELAAPAANLQDAIAAIYAVRDRLLEVVAAANRTGRPGAEAPRGPRPAAPVTGAPPGFLPAAARDLEAGIADINNLAQGWVPVASAERTSADLGELRLLVCALADIREHLLECHRSLPVEHQ